MTIRLDYLLLGAFGAIVIAIGTPGCSRHTAAVAIPAEAPPVAAAPAAPAEPSPPVTPPDMSPAFFSFDSNLLSDSAREALDQVAKLMRDHSEFEVTIEGHCDERGTSEYNQALGEGRAIAAREYLVTAGVAREHIQVVSYGEERPFATGHGEAVWALNRRDQFVVKQATLSAGAGQ